jgi:hypothetical protein
MLEGPDYQAELPKCRPRPKQPLASEARWLTGRVQGAGAWGPVSSRVPVHASLDASSGSVTWCRRPSLTSAPLSSMHAQYSLLCRCCGHAEDEGMPRCSGSRCL